MAELPTVPPSDHDPAPPHCANCGAPLHGPFCHQCGQSTRHAIRHLPALAEDALDLVFNIDGRVMHTLPALFLRPGFLAREYFAGRRARYIPPFRLMFFLSVLAFLVLQFNLDRITGQANMGITVNGIQGDTPAEVRAHLDTAEKDIRANLARTDLTPLARDALLASDRMIRASANARLKALGAPTLPASIATTGARPLEDSAQARQWLQSIRQAPDTSTLDKRRKAARSAIDASLADTSLATGARTQLKTLRDQVDDAASQRRGALTSGAAAPATSGSVSDPDLQVGYVHIRWLPDFINQHIREGVDRMRANLMKVKSGTAVSRGQAIRRIANESLSVLPQTLFVMLPLFALLLKIVYLFKRRLYMEHLMVAMYSHAFIYMSLLLWALVGLLRSVSPSWIAAVLGWIEFAIFLWMPVYLLLMQKRVYAQGWSMTWLKFAVVGCCYTLLVTFAVGAAALIGLAS